MSGSIPPDVAAAVDRWSRADEAHAILPTDREAILATASVRALIVERLLGGESEADRDLLHAFAVLGRLVGSRGGSPTLAAAIVDGAILALSPSPGSASGWVGSARAAVAEAFVQAHDDATRAVADARWEYPACAVGLDDGTVAIAAGYPEDDAEALSAWATRLSHRLVVSGVRRVVLAGSPPALAALVPALDLAGVTRAPGRPLAPSRR